MSRILGLLRDHLIARMIGAGLYSDAFYTAYRIPNMLRDLLGEGALSSLVVAKLGHLKVQDGDQRVRLFIKRLFGFWGVSLSIIACIGILLSPQLVFIIASGFSEKPEQYQLTVELTRLMFPFIAFVGLSALTMGVLHHQKSFGWASAASSFLNLTIILGSSLCYFIFSPDIPDMVFYLAIIYVIGSLMQWASMWPGLIKSKTDILPANPIKFIGNDKDIKDIYLKLIPSIIGVAGVQINVLVNNNFASHLEEGTVTYMYYAFRIMQLPVGIVGVAVSTVLLPTLSEHFAKKDTNSFKNELTNALSKVLILSIPAIFGLCIIGPELIKVLYEHGQFSNTATTGVWIALQGYLIGILPYVFNKNLIQAYYARNDVKFPVIISLSSVAVNASINYLLAFKFGYGVFGLTLGTAIVLCFNTSALVLGLKIKHNTSLNYTVFLKSFFKIFVMSVVMTILVYLCKHNFHFENKYLNLALPTCVGLFSYFGMLFIAKKKKII